VATTNVKLLYDDVVTRTTKHNRLVYKFPCRSTRLCNVYHIQWNNAM